KPLAVFQSTHWRTMAVQFRPEVVTPRDLLDPRVRRALLHAIDRQAIVDTLFEGMAPVSATFAPPDDAKWDWVKDAVVTYEHNPRRAQELLASAGWRQGGDGTFSNAAGERMALAQWTTPGYEQEVAIVADHWKAIGVPS